MDGAHENEDLTVHSHATDRSKQFPSDTSSYSLRPGFLSGEFLARLEQSDRFTSAQLEFIRLELLKSMACNDSVQISFDLGTGTSLAGFTIEKVIGQGGVGRVYLARAASGERVALKVFRGTRVSSRFVREMDVVQRLAHPNIVVAYESGYEDDFAYIAMEYLPGLDLHRFIKRKGPMKWQQSVEVIRQAALGLEHAHERNLVHRDVKPGNLLRDENGVVKIADLGLASSDSTRDVVGGENFRTGEAVVAGTPDFMAPEQARSFTRANAQSDMYSLGATWYFLLTGKSRVPGTTFVEKIDSLLDATQLKSLPDGLLPPELKDIWQLMVAVDVNDRLQTMRQLIQAIDGVYSPVDSKAPKETLDVLIVEDNEDDLYLTIELLRRANHSILVKEAYTLAQAIEVNEAQGGFDIILLDLQLSDSFGTETVVEMRKQIPSTPIVVLTGNDDVVVGRDCINAGADEFTCKSDLTPEQLERILFITQSRASRR